MTRNDKFRNEHIAETLKVDMFGLKIRQRRLKWHGHVWAEDQTTKAEMAWSCEMSG